ncbi:MAG: hypothetical protein DWQ44_03920 [Bacteroidetes bacterium]|nr:MAG: hypothetical protein DWQ33_03355 [Bacteroidota bacterium]REK35460.1 MAG: hypothetical protein DWQ44_03920 [Bacteroidota bacterium]REK46856.1 MAG: hypothetical protein DWQ48_13970 [Bacteroidota bacterium]
MKKKSYKAFTMLMLFVTALLSSCEKTEEDPNTSDRDKFLGSWRGFSTGPGGDINFNMNISASNSAPDQILMSNFDGTGSNTFIPAVVSGNSLTIPTFVGVDTIQGSGNYNSNNTLSFTFVVRDGQTVENRTATAQR